MQKLNQILCSLCVLLLVSPARAFVFGGIALARSLHRPNGVQPRQGGVLAATCQLGNLEMKQVQRWKDLDKVCKTCPAKIQPVVDTLTEMIVGLSDKERLELVAKVSLKLSGQDAAGLLQTPGIPTVAQPIAMGTQAMADLDIVSGDPERKKASATLAGMFGVDETSAMSLGHGKEMKMKEKEMGGMKDKMAEKRCKMEKKIKEYEMDIAVYEAEQKFMGMAIEDTANLQQVAVELLQNVLSALYILFDNLPAKQGRDCSEMDRAEMIKDLTMNLMQLREMKPENRAIRELKIVEKLAKKIRKMAECKMELAELAQPVAVC